MIDGFADLLPAIFFPLTASGAGFGVNFDKAWDAPWLNWIQCFFHLAMAEGQEHRCKNDAFLTQKHRCGVFGKLENRHTKKNKKSNLYFFGGGGNKNYQPGCQWFQGYNFIHFE